jgi:methylamine utilization protein MauE/AhpC/TSA family protein
VAGVLDWVLLCLRLGVATILLVAAAAKLSDRTGTRESLSKFGVPGALARPGAVALPLAELAVAALLVPAATARAGAAAALAMLVLFSAVLARAAIRGEAADCNCFGSFASASTKAALARNAVLIGAAAAVVAAGVGQAVGDLSTPGLLAIIFAFVAGLQAWVSWQLLRRNMRLLEELQSGRDDQSAPRAHGLRSLEVGDEAPAFALPDASGEIHTLYDLLLPGLPLALVFSDPDCGACETLPDRLAQLQQTLAGELEVALVTRGGPVPGSFAPVLLQRDHEVTHAYGASQIPSAVLISPDGRIASALATGDLAVEELLTRELLEVVS